MNTKTEANPLIWGAWGGIVGGIAGAIAVALNALPDGQSITGFVAGGFFWLWVVALVRNKLANRRPS